MRGRGLRPRRPAARCPRGRADRPAGNQNAPHERSRPARLQGPTLLPRRVVIPHRHSPDRQAYLRFPDLPKWVARGRSSGREKTHRPEYRFAGHCTLLKEKRQVRRGACYLNVVMTVGRTKQDGVAVEPHCPSLWPVSALEQEPLAVPRRRFPRRTPPFHSSISANRGRSPISGGCCIRSAIMRDTHLCTTPRCKIRSVTTHPGHDGTAGAASKPTAVRPADSKAATSRKKCPA